MGARNRTVCALVILASLCIPPALAAGPESGASGRAAPDLTVVAESFATNPDPARLWDTIRINVTVINQGDADAGSFGVAFYLNNTSRLIGTSTVTSLSASNTTNVSVSWATATTETFEYHEGVVYKILVRVDHNSRVIESDETNNEFLFDQVLGPPRLPDLALVGFSVDPPAPVKGDLVTVNVSFTNIGEAQARFFRVYIYNDSVDSTIGYVDVTTTNLSEIKNVSFEWDTSGLSVGTHALLVHVNPEFLFTSIREQSWDNNNGTREVVVSAPDFELGLVSLVLSPAGIHVGDTLNATWSLRNGGPRPAEDFTVLAFLDGYEFFRERVPRLDPGENRSFGAENDTGMLPVGDHTFRLSAGNIDTERTFALRPVRMADLVLRNVSWEPPSPLVDQSVQVSLQVFNDGGLASRACEMAVFVDFSASPAMLRPVPALEPGAGSDQRFLWDTGGLHAGPHELRLQIDSGHVVPELNETNNNFRLDIEIRGEMDLGLENLTISPRPPRAGDGVVFSVSVRNLGSIPSPATNLSLDVNGLPVDHRAIGALDRGRSAPVTLAWATTGLPSGNYTFNLTLLGIPDDVAPEDNRLSDVLSLLPPPPAPDLRVSRIVADPADPRVGDTLTLRILLENAGNLDCGPSSVMIYLDNGVALLKFMESPAPVPSIAVGRSVTVNVSRGTASFQPGMYILNASVDYRNEIAELDETNNRLSMELRLGEPVVLPPRLSVGELSVQGELLAGSEIVLSVTVTNDGQGDALSVNVTLIIDGNASDRLVLDRLPAGSSQTVSFNWKATPGAHTLAVVAQAGDTGPAATPMRTLSVTRPAAPAAAADLTAPIIAAVVLVAVAAAGAGLALMRRRKG
ncbi:MAG: hypothetical protein FJ149_05825 [Euryarchaeota archaeon]|nr:hypothetical protein [Euryarchaeota archaeon]